MKTKQHNGFIGYGSTDDEALTSCQIISLLQGAYNASNFEGLENRRLNLAPWKPKMDSLHIKGVGYITIKENHLNAGQLKLKMNSNLFEMLYKSFFNSLSMVDVLLCFNEIQEFLQANGVKVPSLSSYGQVVPNDLDMIEEDVVSNIISNSYSIVFFNDNKVGIKRNAEELYWVCSFNSEYSSVTDAVYYISYVRGYEGIEHIIKEEL